MMNKGILIADPHFHGDTYDPLGSERASFKWQIWSYMIDYAIQNRHKFIAILGDLFDRPNPNESLRRKFYETTVIPASNAGIPVIYIAGNHCSTLTNPCFIGESYVKQLQPYFKVVTGTESIPLNDYLLQYDFNYSSSIYGLSWYGSLIPNWYGNLARDGKEVLVLAHIAMQGAYMNNNIECVHGTSVKSLKDNNIKVIAGHFHKSQDNSNYSYVGSCFRQNFGEQDYTPCFMELSENGNTNRIILEDWEFQELIVENGKCKIPSLNTYSNPTVIKVNIVVNNRSEALKYNNDYLKKLVQEAGFTNCQNIKKNIITDYKTIKKPDTVDLLLDIKQSILEYGKQNKISDLHQKVYNKFILNVS